MAAGIAGHIYRQLNDENYFARNHAEATFSTLASFTSGLPSLGVFKAPNLMMDATTKTDISAENPSY
jgi:hypothetical protein